MFLVIKDWFERAFQITKCPTFDVPNYEMHIVGFLLLPSKPLIKPESPTLCLHKLSSSVLQTSSFTHFTSS